MSDPNLSPSFDETGQVDELALRRNRNRSAPEYSTEEDLGIENDLSPDDDDDFDTAGTLPYDDYDDAIVVDDPDEETPLASNSDDDDDDDDDDSDDSDSDSDDDNDELIYDDDER